MNKARAKKLRDISDKLDEIASQIQELRDEEEEYLDNMPENLQGSEKYDAAQVNVSELDEALDSLQSVNDSLLNAAGDA